MPSAHMRIALSFTLVKKKTNKGRRSPRSGPRLRSYTAMRSHKSARKNTAGRSWSLATYACRRNTTGCFDTEDILRERTRYVLELDPSYVTRAGRIRRRSHSSRAHKVTFLRCSMAFTSEKSAT